jgi:hypothetical protein
MAMVLDLVLIGLAIALDPLPLTAFMASASYLIANSIYLIVT